MTSPTACIGNGITVMMGIYSFSSSAEEKIAAQSDGASNINLSDAIRKGEKRDLED